MTKVDLYILKKEAEEKILDKLDVVLGTVNKVDDMFKKIDSFVKDIQK